MTASDITPTQALAQRLGMAHLTMLELADHRPRFDLLPFVDCARMGCAFAEPTQGVPVLLMTDGQDVDRLQGP